jgi:hypothetical protein
MALPAAALRQRGFKRPFHISEISARNARRVRAPPAALAATADHVGKVISPGSRKDVSTLMSRFISRSALRDLRLLGPAAVAATLALGALPALAQTAPTASGCAPIRFELSNPGPGSRVEPGAFVLAGVAMDSRSQQGPGIDRIDFFLDSRDQGGMSLGSAVPGMLPGPFGQASFQTTLMLPNLIGGHDLFAYAHSSVTDQESVISVPIALGEDPSKAGQTEAQGNVPSSTETCAPATGTRTTTTTTTTITATAPGAATTSPTAPTTSASPSASTVTLEVGNPSPGDTIHVGGYSLEGTAFDRGAQTGNGIDRIDIFLDNRDDGGLLLGGAAFGQNNVWHATVTLPSNQTGLHSLVFYAHSASTGSETVVSVPVTIAP